MANRRLTTEEFIKKARAVHGNRYDYSKTKYIKSTEKVIIIDPEYGNEFEIRPTNHLFGRGNPLRTNNKKKTTEQFIDDARKVHGELYDYSKTVYVNARTKVIIIDPEYGEFQMDANHHIHQAAGHPLRAMKSRKEKLAHTKEVFIEKAKKVHGNLYDYTKVDYINSATKVCIIDSEYGEFWQSPEKHTAGANHPQRAIEISKKNATLTQEEFIRKARNVHGNLYDYSKSKYLGSETKLCIIDPEYGEFWQKPSNHLMGKGHRLRGIKKIKEAKTKSLEQFIEDARKVHGDLYDYTKVDYINAWAKICIIDPEYGEFWQAPNNHLSGNGHPSRAQTGFDPTKEAILYYLSILGGKAYKIGITNRTLRERFGVDMDKIKIIKTWHYPLGMDAYKEEQRIIKEFKDAKYVGQDLLENARTAEMFKYDILGLDKGPTQLEFKLSE